MCRGGWPDSAWFCLPEQADECLNFLTSASYPHEGADKAAHHLRQKRVCLDIEQE